MSKKTTLSFKKKTEVFSRDGYRCKKCGSRLRSDELEVHHIKMRVDGGNDEIGNLITLCSICHYFSPDDEVDFEKYIAEKIDGRILDTFRKSSKSVSKRTKKGMLNKSKNGSIVTRAPYGYKIVGGNLVANENTSYIVPEIFEDFLNKKISLTKLAKKYGFSVNGLKKILMNQTYLGKIKFDKQTHKGTHQALISSTLFNHVQNKLEELGIKK